MVNVDAGGDMIWVPCVCVCGNREALGVRAVMNAKAGARRG